MPGGRHDEHCDRQVERHDPPPASRGLDQHSCCDHPGPGHVDRRHGDELARQMGEADSPYVVLSSPLLLESGQSETVDVSVVVDVPEALQIKRTMARDQNDRQLVEQIMAAQLDRETRIARADMVIDNSTSLDALHKRAAVLHETLLARAAAH